MDRRRFLIASGGSILGLGFVHREEPPAWFDQGLKKIAASGLPGVVVVVPDEHVELIRLSDALGARLASESAAVVEALAGAVWICLRQKDARARFKSVSRLMRIDASGARTAGADVALKAFESDEAFAAAAARILDADLEAREKRAWEAAGEALRAELATLAHDDPARRDAAHRAVAARMPRVTPILIRTARTTADPETAARCRAILRESLGAGPALPFGAAWVDGIGCGDPRLDHGGIRCGKARPDPSSRKLLAFLAAPAR